MKELLLAYPDLRTAQFPALIQAVCKTLTDAEASVRSLLPPLLSAVLPLVPTSTLAPHLPVLLLHATSALSSIFPAVRVDAVRVLGVLLDEGGAGCDRIADGWETGSGGRGEGGRVLEGLLAVLGVGGKGETAGSNAPLGTAVSLRLTCTA
jgi:pre-rRNA-processing protein IPI1